VKLFVSVGTQLPFERLLNAVDNVIGVLNIEKCVYQIAESDFNSKYGVVYKYLSPIEYKKEFDECDVFISHAGMGSIITALDELKPIIIFPRLHSCGEHRNNHQLSTAEKFKNFDNVYYAESEDEILGFLKSDDICNVEKIDSLKVDNMLLEFLEIIIND